MSLVENMQRPNQKRSRVEQSDENQSSREMHCVVDVVDSGTRLVACLQAPPTAAVDAFGLADTWITVFLGGKGGKPEVWSGYPRMYSHCKSKGSFHAQTWPYVITLSMDMMCLVLFLSRLVKQPPPSGACWTAGDIIASLAHTKEGRVDIESIRLALVGINTLSYDTFVKACPSLIKSAAPETDNM